MFNYTKCLKVTQRINNDSIIIEHCGDIMADLNGLYVVLLEDGIPVIKDYIFTHLRRNAQHSINMLDNNPSLVLKMLLSIDSEVRSNSYTALFLRDAGSIQSLISGVYERDLADKEAIDAAASEKPVQQMDMFGVVTAPVVDTTRVSLEKTSTKQKSALDLPDDLQDDPFIAKIPDAPVVSVTNDEMVAQYNVRLEKDHTESTKPISSQESSNNTVLGSDLHTEVASTHNNILTTYDVGLMKDYIDTFNGDEVKGALIKVVESLNSVNDYKMITSFLTKFTDAIEV